MEPMASEGSGNPSSPQCKINTCLPHEPLNTASSFLPAERELLNFCWQELCEEEEPSPSTSTAGTLAVRAKTSSSRPQASALPDLSTPVSPLFLKYKILLF